MSASIRRQISIVFIIFMATTILFSVAINYFFLERFYQSHKIEEMDLIYNRLNEASTNGELFVEKLFEDEFTAFDLELIQVANKYNVEILILDKNGNNTICTTKLERILASRLVDYTRAPDELQQQLILREDRYAVMLTPDPLTSAEYVEMWGFLDSEDVFLIRTSMEGISESVKIANRFLLYIGAILLMIGFVAIYFITKRISEPITQLSILSEEMAKMNFNVKYSGTSRNELGLLGRNINRLSDALEQNISDLKTANYELKKDIEKKEEIDEIRKEFISNISHELKTPIALIQGYAEGLADNINEEDGSKEFYCDVIVDEAKKLNTIVGHLMTLNQLEEGNTPVSIERFDITELIKNTLQSMEILLEQKEIRASLEIEQSIYVWADEFKIEEVVRNYLSNAINHCAGEMEINVSAIEEDGIVRILVFNTGENIPNDSLPYVWDKFYKVDKARTREYGGSGVGLSIVKAIMESMKMNYGVDNLNTGVSFWFEVETK